MAAQGQNLAAEVGEELEELGNPVQQLEKPHRVAQNMGLDMAKHYMYLVDSMEVPQVSQVRLQHSYLLLFTFTLFGFRIPLDAGASVSPLPVDLCMMC